ncbi:HEPN domain-containing protein [Nostoc sp.]|uniref:HEPN domain-containing protein n=1 Tax=Nostoc sp. TaxID=1180 RepID=UPI002FF4686C
MNFDWSEYLNVAKELAGGATTSANQEAKFRAAISRAYYAAFITARNHLRDQEEISIPKTSDAHRYVSDQFELSSDLIRKSVAKKLARLRGFRKQADYVDKFPGLSGITIIALDLSEEIISILSNL